MLAVTRADKDDPTDEIAYRRLGLNSQAARYEFKGTFGKTQLRAASRHHGGRASVRRRASVEVCQSLCVAAQHELGAPEPRPVPRRVEI
jgi:hypothetical protein